MGDRDDEQPLTLRRALRAPEFWLLLVASVAATAGLAWWMTVPLVVAGLSIVSKPKYVALWPRAQDVGAELEWWNLFLLRHFLPRTPCAPHYCGARSSLGVGGGEILLFERLRVVEGSLGHALIGNSRCCGNRSIALAGAVNF
jgi:hypothetical protein